MLSAPRRWAWLVTLFLAVPVVLARAATVTENFSDFDSTKWVIGRDSFWNQAEENFYLTPSTYDQRGRLYYAVPFTISEFTVSFDYRIFDGSEADGLTFAFVRDPNYASDDTEGGYLDFTGADGYAVEFDTWENEWDPSGRHIAVIQNSTENHLAFVNVETRGDHHADIGFASGNLTVIFDGKEVLTYDIPDFVQFTGYFGFTAATGWGTDNQVIDNVILTLPDCGDTLTGRVLFEDNLTPVRVAGGPKVRVVAYRRESKEQFRVFTDDTSAYVFASGSLPEGTYDLVAVYYLASQFVHEEYAPVVFQPANLSPNPDFIVDENGMLSRCSIDIIFPWPAILLHGVINPLKEGDTGPNDFEMLQQYLSISDRKELLIAPRQGVISLVPDMLTGCYDDYYMVLRDVYLNENLPATNILSFFPAATKFNIVGYSQGGLVARLLLQDPGAKLPADRINKVLQTATPNAGSCRLGAKFYPCLSEDEMRVFNNQNTDGQGRPFYVLAGDIWIQLGCFLTLHHDKAVLTDSVFYIGPPDLPGYDVREEITVEQDHNAIVSKRIDNALDGIEWMYAHLVD